MVQKIDGCLSLGGGWVVKKGGSQCLHAFSFTCMFEIKFFVQSLKYPAAPGDCVLSLPRGCSRARVRDDDSVSWFLPKVYNVYAYFIHHRRRYKGWKSVEHSTSASLKPRQRSQKWSGNPNRPVFWEAGDKGQRSNNLGSLPLKGGWKVKYFITSFLFFLAHRAHLTIFNEKNQVMKSHSSLLFRHNFFSGTKTKEKLPDWHCMMMQSAFVCYTVIALNPDGPAGCKLTFRAQVKVDAEKDTGGRIWLWRPPETAVLHPFMLHSRGHSELLSPPETRIGMQLYSTRVLLTFTNYLLHFFLANMNNTRLLGGV